MEKQDAKSETAKKMELHKIYETHDLVKFRAFCIENEVVNIEKLSEEELSNFLHTIKAKLPYMGSDFHASRRIIRMMDQGWTEEEIDRDFNGELPICARCKYFRTPPEGEERACMHLGSIPEDVICRGYLPIE